MTAMGAKQSNVRWREHGFEMRCGSCNGWWTLDLACWKPKNGMKRCRACWADFHRLHEAGRNTIEVNRELKLANGRIAYRLNREERLAYNRRWKAANRERVAEYNRRYRAGGKAA